jgi:hypothetical protein
MDAPLGFDYSGTHEKEVTAMRSCIPRPILMVALLLTLAGGCTVAPEPGERAVRFTRITDSAPATDAASTGGVSWVDFDGDGDLDLFVTNGYDVSAEEATAQKNRLYRNDGDGVLSVVTEGPLIEDDGFSSGSTWGDFDNDGDVDVFVSNQRDQENFLYRNEGDGTFERIDAGSPTAAGASSFSASWVDVDRDGLLDLWIANGGLSQAQPNQLHRALGEGRFSAITDGDIVTLEGRSGGGSWGDYDNDGDPDLFVAHLTLGADAPGNQLYRNDGDWQLIPIEDGPPVDDGAPSLCAAWGDYDNDQDLDLYVGNAFGYANLLYRNEGDGRLTPVEHIPPTLEGGSTYAANWADVDNDGDLDLLVADWGSAPVLYENLGGEGFRRLAAGDLGRDILFAASLAWGDYDADGDLDAYVGNWPNHPGPGEPNALYRNDSAAAGWLQIDLRGTLSNRSGIGARVLVRARIGGEARTQLREVAAHTGWRSQNSLRQHVGLGDARTVEQVEVRWPSGNVDQVGPLDGNRIIEITEGKGLTSGAE